MCKAMEDRINESLVQVALNMLAKGKLSVEEIAEYSGLSLEKVKELAAEASRVNA